jgi:hypothetical protein
MTTEPSSHPSLSLQWVGVFAIAWNSRRFLENNYLLFLGIAYLFVGALVGGEVPAATAD